MILLKIVGSVVGQYAGHHGHREDGKKCSKSENGRQCDPAAAGENGPLPELWLRIQVLDVRGGGFPVLNLILFAQCFVARFRQRTCLGAKK